MIASLRVFFLLCLTICLAGAGQIQPHTVRTKTSQTKPAAPAGFADRFEELAQLVSVEELGTVAFARASYLAVRLLNAGSAGTPYMLWLFENTGHAESCFLSGAYISVHGSRRDLLRMRSILETNRIKQYWLKQLFGDGKALSLALQDGQKWQDAVSILPTLTGCRNLSLLCMQSQDPLVRRAGLYWGYWVGDAAYWRSVQKRASNDADALTRRFATILLQRERAKG